MIKRIVLFLTLALIMNSASVTMAEEVIKPPVDGTGELIVNGGFETANTPQTGPAGFSAYNGWTGGAVNWNTTDPHGGNYCVELNGDGSPYALYVLRNITGGAEYQITTWLKRVSVSNDMGPYIKFEYRKNSLAIGQNDSQSFISSSEAGVWSQVVTRVIAPINADEMRMLFRISGSGQVYWDDVSCFMTENAPAFTLDTNVFYYSGTTGTATAAINTNIAAIPEGANMDFSVLDGTAELYSASTAVHGEEVSFSFDADVMPNPDTAYTARCIYKTASGTEILTQEELIYRYDRPSSLNADGEIIKNGEIFTPVIPYHTNYRVDTDYIKAAGANVNSSGNSYSPQQHLDALNAAEAAGLMCIVSLYRDMKPACDEANIQNTIDTVNLVRNHPALLGYNIMDEPFLHDTPDVVEENLKISYQTIRGLDSVHPVMLMETYYDKAMFPIAGKYCDIFMVDPYPASKTSLGTYTENVVKAAKEALGYKKAVYSIVQAFDWQNYLPTGNDVRYQVYASLFAGADGFGYFKFRAWTVPYNHLWTYTGEDGMWTGITSFAENEQEDAVDVFIKGRYPVMNFVRSNDAVYIIYIKNDEVYLIAMNLLNEQLNMEIPLTSYDKSITLGEFTAEAVDISGAAPVSGNGSFNLSLPATTVAKFKLTLSETPDFSEINVMTYRDLDKYSSSRKAIETLSGAGLMEGANGNSFMPSKPVTAPEFGEILEEALGLSHADYGTNTSLTYGEALSRAAAALKSNEVKNYNAITACMLESAWKRALCGEIQMSAELSRADAAKIIYGLMTDNCSGFYKAEDEFNEILLSEITAPTGTMDNNIYSLKNGEYIILYNCGDSEALYTTQKSGESMRIIYGADYETTAYDGTNAEVTVPPGSMVILKISGGDFRGLYGSGRLCIEKAIAGEYTFKGVGLLAVYSKHNGIKRLEGAYKNGDTVRVSGDSCICILTWQDDLMPIAEAYWFE